MAYRRKRFYRRRRITRKKSTRFIKKLVRKAVKAIRPELKYDDSLRPSIIDDTGYLSTWTSATPNSLSVALDDQALGFYHTPGVNNKVPARVICLTNMWLNTPYQDPTTGHPAGPRYNSVNGWAVNAKFLRLRLKLSAVASGLTEDNILDGARYRFRVMILIQKDYSPTFALYPPSTRDIITYGLSSTTTNDSTLTAPFVPGFKDRFGVLHDKTYMVSNNRGAGWIDVKINKRLRQTIKFIGDNPIKSLDNEAIYNAAARGSMYLVIMGAGDTNQGSATITPTFDLMSRIYYTDP